jgi:hypothetical protein
MRTKEIHSLLAGRSFFGARRRRRRVSRIRMTQGLAGLLVLPVGIYHGFMMDEGRREFSVFKKMLLLHLLACRLLFYYLFLTFILHLWVNFLSVLINWLLLEGVVLLSSLNCFSVMPFFLNIIVIFS